MKIHAAKITFFSLIAATVLGVPALSYAQAMDPNTQTAPTKSKHGAPFHGTVDALDTNAMTLTVGSRTFQITSDTRIFKNDKPAILGDAAAGQHVSGYYKPSDEGTNLDASSVYFGSHATKAKAKKKKAPAPEMTSTNGAPDVPVQATPPPPPPGVTPPPPMTPPATQPAPVTTTNTQAGP